jgi:sugar lactone lactonase YvrE
LSFDRRFVPDGQFNRPFGVATDAGNVYVADVSNSRIQKFSGTGTYLRQWGSFGSGNGQFGSPTGMAIDASGNVYVADSGNNRVQKFGHQPVSVEITTWGRTKSLYRN